MLRSLKDLEKYQIMATDGELGHVKDFYFDDRNWIIRYLVVDTGKWLPGRLTLIPPTQVASPDWETHLFPVNLTKEEIKNSPSIDENKPVSRQMEIKLHDHFQWPYYWVGPGPFGAPGAGAYPIPPGAAEEAKAEIEVEGDPHLRSMNEVRGYRIEATDGEIGHLDDLIGEDTSWTVRYVVVDTRNWLPGRKVLLNLQWIESFEWEEQKVVSDLTKEAIESSPPYHASDPVNREYEEELYDYYGRQKYWR